MKTPQIALCIALAASTPTVMASIIAQDNFSYALGELNTQNGGTGWAGA